MSPLNSHTVHHAMHADMQLGNRSTIEAINVACKQACMQQNSRCGNLLNDQSSPDSLKDNFCPLGFSIQQINLLTAIIHYNNVIMTYSELAQQVNALYCTSLSADAVRGTVARLAKRGALICQRARMGTRRGVRIETVHGMLCSSLQQILVVQRPLMRSGMRSAVPIVMQDGMSLSMHPSLLDKIDRKESLSISPQYSEGERLLALSEGDVVGQWPLLAKAGFGPDQIHQLVRHWEKLGIAYKNVVQSLNHAEWFLGQENPCDAKGVSIGSPRDWVFRTLMRQGYYPRPKGYISAQEQAEKDQEAEATALKEAQERCFSAVCNTWISALSPEERSQIVQQGNSMCGGPEDVRLRRHFRNKIWPARYQQPTPTGENG